MGAPARFRRHRSPSPSLLRPHRRRLPLPDEEPFENFQEQDFELTEQQQETEGKYIS
ncbi:hypothetical protein C2845_PM13G04850 [Panicum miliaceum]|uniref:Uncharacterized protein n=1 Tax=Panicum miliaceum TaxID=4540 RepID=A0A3L6RGG9_PANMI|nr:hypothetical protein C2845_PM13G04850 [Panicum miliaceum]